MGGDDSVVAPPGGGRGGVTLGRWRGAHRDHPNKDVAQVAMGTPQGTSGGPRTTPAGTWCGGLGDISGAWDLLEDLRTPQGGCGLVALGTFQGLGTFLTTWDHLNNDMGRVAQGTPEGAGTFLTWDLPNRDLVWWPWAHSRELGPS